MQLKTIQRFHLLIYLLAQNTQNIVEKNKMLHEQNALAFRH